MPRLLAVRRRGQSSVLVPLLWATLPFALAGLSWWAQETPHWGTITSVVFVVLAIGLGVGLKVFMAGIKFTRGVVLAYVSLVLSFVAWIVGGRIDPVSEARVASDLKTPLRVSYGDEELHTLPAPGEYTFRRRRLDPARVRLEVLTPEGWEALPLKTERSGDDFLQERWVKFQVDHAQQPMREVGLWVDNRDGPDCTLKCGKWQQTAPAGQKSVAYFYFRGDAPPLHVNDREAGPLSGNQWLIDPTGMRGYRLRTIRYGGNDLFWPGAAEEESRGKLMHKLPRPLDYFLEPAPDSIKAHAVVGTTGVDKLEVTEAP